MRKLSIAMSVVLLAGTAGLVWADAASKDAGKVNPQPLPPQGVQQIGGANSGINQDGDGINPTDTHEGGGKDLGDGSDDAKPHKGLSKKSSGGIVAPSDSHNRKAGGENVTLHDQAQINGNLNGDGHAFTGGGKGLKKGTNGTQKVLIGLDKANNLQKANGIKKASGFDKASGLSKGFSKGFTKVNGDGKLLPAVQK